MPLSIFDNPVEVQIVLHELFEAYFACRKNKRNTANAIAFEVDYKDNLVQLCEEINNGNLSNWTFHCLYCEQTR